MIKNKTLVKTEVLCMTYLIKFDNEVLIASNDVRNQFSDKDFVLKLRICCCNYMIYIINICHNNSLVVLKQHLQSYDSSFASFVVHEQYSQSYSSSLIRKF